MKVLKSILLAGGALALATAAQAADLPTKKTPVVPEKPNCYATFWTWLDSSAADCPLSYWGVTFYGQIDVGLGYESNAAKFNNAYPQGIQNIVSAQSHGGKFQWIPNGLSQSNVGLKWKEQIVKDWYFIGDVNAGFDPYSLQYANGPRSLVENNLTPAFARSANGDSSRAYGPINARAYAGIQNQTFGTLTYGRHYAFSNDIANALYDPFGGAYDFSLIGNSSTLGGGMGDTELARYNNSVRYMYADHNIRVGGMTQVGGWSAGNNAQQAYEFDLGFDWAGFSIDGVYEHAKDAVALGILGANAVSPTLLKATIENENSIGFGAKYKWDKFTAYGGYFNEQISNPTDLPATATIRDFNGGVQAVYGASGLGSQGPLSGPTSAFPKTKIVQVLWIGGKYAVLPNVDLIGGYYHVWQNDYLGSAETFGGPAASCAPNTGANPAGGKLYGTNNAKCAGHEDVIAGVVDWRPWKRVDIYAGSTYSKVTGGLASGFFANDDLGVTGGVRVSF